MIAEKTGKKARIGIVDTMFARVDMASFAIDQINRDFPGKVQIFRSTVPGVKDLAVGCLLLHKQKKCDAYLTLGMVGKEKIDTQCGHEASIGIQMAKLAIGRHIIEVFVHEWEGRNESDLYSIFEDRTRKHAVNAVLLASNPGALVKFAGTGKRQGRRDAGQIHKQNR
ncbi:MAG: riboflavin synthase [Candidatus Micrarchaeota archaeon]|nr:riboflavin synthase [Candidatus Micrarchaeota archaeon]